MKVGDTVAVEQPLIELETDKATIEVPSSVAGTVSAIQVKAGDKVTIGQAVMTIATAGGTRASEPAAASAPQATAAAPGSAVTDFPAWTRGR